MLPILNRLSIRMKKTISISFTKAKDQMTFKMELALSSISRLFRQKSSRKCTRTAKLFASAVKNRATNFTQKYMTSGLIWL